MKLSEHASVLAAFAENTTALVTKVEKIGTETSSLLDAVAALQAAVEEAGNTTPEIDNAMALVTNAHAALNVALQTVDDKVADAP